VTLPTLLFAFAISTLYGAGFHVLLGGSSRRLALYLAAGWLGFTMGHLAGELWGVTAVRVGSLNFLAATLGSALALIGARWLAAREGSMSNSA
jgi:hypothetical protein